MAPDDRFPARQAIQIRARKAGIEVYALSSGASFDFDPEPRDDMLVFGYSSLPEEGIEAAVNGLHRLLGSAREACSGCASRTAVPTQRPGGGPRMGKANSYVRFSRPEQMRGDSLCRWDAAASRRSS